MLSIIKHKAVFHEMEANIRFARSFMFIQKNTRRFNFHFPTFFLHRKGNTVALKPDSFSWRFHLTNEGREKLEVNIARQYKLIKLLQEESTPDALWVLLKHSKDGVIQSDGSTKIYFNPYTVV